MDEKNIDADPVGVNDATLHYLDVIYRLTRRGNTAKTNDIANKLGVTASGASVMLRRLTERGLTELTPYKGVTLTETGERIAIKTIRRHRLLELFLHKTMNFAWHEVDEHAHVLETAINDALEERINLMLGHPTRCPHGHLIPDKNGNFPPNKDVRLVQQPIGSKGQLSCVDTDNGDWLKYLGEQGFALGELIVLKGIAPYGSTVVIQTAQQECTLGYNLAELLYVEM